ncbi:GNAT family N-acetyltransferase [Flavobacterium channae]|uniref:GNAT family N-acetyltransferase n=1 Tax=Flavobacterium channae TaxID=2897181 RepID=UPI001E4B234F|nr:GNAT family N-acetyltransferase [Flavobacterium channae]UGS23536.1 GNAT family N-acetyltransferase [Flavobacterium channae]
MHELVELVSKEQMLAQLPIIQQLYPDYTFEIYGNLLDKMIPHNYKQLIVVENNTTVGLAGFWIGTKLWSGKYLELDNVVVHNDFRSKGIGSIMTEYLNQKAIDENCNMIVLDAYTTNFGAQKFYMNHGFVPKGFHFVKYLK